VTTELIGITATLVVLISFLAKEPKNIRLINTIGAVLFIIYGIAINAVSVYLLNGALVLIHAIYLIDLLTERKPHEKPKDEPTTNHPDRRVCRRITDL
jgi:hypothetical protein